MTEWNCPECSETFQQERWWVYHLKWTHNLAPVRQDSAIAVPPRVSTAVSTMSTTSAPPPRSSNPVVDPNLRLRMEFHVVYHLHQGDEERHIRTTVPKDESYNNFLRRLQHVFYGESFERSLRQWEYILVDRKYKRGDPLPLTSPNTYYAMVSELLSSRSRWRHAVIRRSVSSIE